MSGSTHVCINGEFLSFKSSACQMSHLFNETGFADCTKIEGLQTTKCQEFKQIFQTIYLYLQLYESDLLLDRDKPQTAQNRYMAYKLLQFSIYSANFKRKIASKCSIVFFETVKLDKHYTNIAIVPSQFMIFGDTDLTCWTKNTFQILRLLDSKSRFYQTFYMLANCY